MIPASKDHPTRLPLRSLRDLPTPRATRKLASLLGVSFVVLPILLVVVPWQQNVPGSGRVTALDPLDRVQILPAPVTGRLVKVNVQEGSVVEEGQILAEMADQDPNYVLRLEQQFEFTRDEVQAARTMLDFYSDQLITLEDGREQAISEATFALNETIEKVRSEERKLEAIEAELDQKRADRERKSTLWTQGVVSELVFQEAERDYKAARAKVEGAKNDVEAVRNEEKAKMAKISKVSAEELAKIQSTQSKREEARAKVAEAEKKLNDAKTKLVRQQTQTIVAPRSGTIMRVHAASSADLLSRGAPLIELVPHTDRIAVELWVRGVDGPLITPGRKVRIQFEGWPAVQFAGWPSVAVGTYGGVVHIVDAQARSDGRIRVLVLPDPDDEEWPEAPFLRQGVRANGWLLLDTVRLGFEFWRQLNAFPPTVDKGQGADAPPKAVEKDEEEK